MSKAIKWMLKPTYVRWRDWWFWILLPREKKQKFDRLIRQAFLLQPLLRNHPDIVEKIRAKESCSWALSQKDATDSLESLKRYLQQYQKITDDNSQDVPGNPDPTA